jgi:predicted TIM-barrel fold metal-dependent hydrolase
VNAREFLLDKMRRMPIVNTHSHHLPDGMYEGVGLKQLLDNTYAAWASKAPDPADAGAVERYVDENLCNTYFRWLFRALEELYGIAPTPANFPELDRRVRAAYENPAHHLGVLTDVCRFEKIISDRQPDPGSDLNHPELFFPSFRCDGYFSGYLKGKPDPNGFLARSTFEKPDVGSVGEYVDEMRRAIARKKAAGCVAVKVAIAYERPLDFSLSDEAAAARALDNPSATAREVTAFGNLVMRGVCRAAGELGIPVQIHTGMGQLVGTNPILLVPLIEEFPETKFHLLHGGFPWLDDTLAILHNFKNVWSDAVWIPYLSTRKAVDYLISALEVSGATRLTWGCDAWMSEDSLGALRAMEHVLSIALSTMVDDGAFSVRYAETLARRVFSENARALFGLY